MKIKAVCEETGLTDRAVRYYIDEGLIRPEFTENYVGRRSYDFSLEDISLLSDISTLRKFGFTVSEVKDIIIDPSRSSQIIKAVKERKYCEIQNNTAAISVLEKMDFSKPYTLPEIAAELEGFTRFAPLPAEDNRLSNKAIIRLLIYTVLSTLGVVFIIFPIFCFVWTIMIMRAHEYLSFDVVYVTVCVCLMCAPLFLSLIFKIFNRRIKTNFGVRLILYIISYLCLYMGLFAFAYTDVSSYTTDMNNYLEFGKDDWAQSQKNEDFIANVFPEEPFESSRGEIGKYYYRGVVGYSGGDMELFAEWTLNEESFNKEVNRVKYYLSNYDSIKDDFKTIQLGDFSCLFSSNRENWYLSADDLFSCKFFAYNAKTNTVRYYFGDGQYYCFGDDSLCVNLEW